MDVVTLTAAKAAAKLLQAPRSAVVVAASDSPNKAGAHFICTGTADEVTINAAIASLGTAGGKVLLRAGTYLLADQVVIARDLVTLEGEGFGFWGGFTGGSPGTGAEGVGITKVKQTVTGKNIIKIDNAAGTDRRMGITIRDLYLYGYNNTGTGILCNDTSRATDQLTVEHVFIHHVLNGMDLLVDAPHISDVTIMDCGGYGISVAGSGFGSIRGCCIADITGDGIIIGASCTLFQVIANQVVRAFKGMSNAGAGTVIQGNTINACRDYGLYLTAGAEVLGNAIDSGVTTRAAIYAPGGSGYVVIGNRLTSANNAAYPVLYFQSASDSVINGNYIGGRLTSNSLVALLGCTGIVMTGNRLINFLTTAGYAINVDSMALGAIANNVASGGLAASKYNLPDAAAAFVNSGNV